jgi:hypothetical protein
VERRERFYAVKHFSAFVGEGWSRVDADCADSELKTSAYIGPGGTSLVAVLINPTRTERRVTLQPDGGFEGAESQVYRSTEGESGERWRGLGALPADRSVTLPPRSVATIRWDKPPGAAKPRPDESDVNVRAGKPAANGPRGPDCAAMFQRFLCGRETDWPKDYLPGRLRP